uniref:Uncharacterized protein n=1 Tax=Moumouvirus sp. 'Monve' TaxID=1128131 RepID=H2EFK0_9VIRU|nr:hypothetical protein mv_R1063 [Moumouvirus Monve]
MNNGNYIKFDLLLKIIH